MPHFAFYPPVSQLYTLAGDYSGHLGGKEFAFARVLIFTVARVMCVYVCMCFMYGYLR